MNTLKYNAEIRSGRRIEKYTILQFVVNSMRTRPVKKIFLHFYGPALPQSNGLKPNEAKRIP